MNLAQRIILLSGLLVVGLCLRAPYRSERTIYLVNPETGASHEAGVTFESLGHQCCGTRRRAPLGAPKSQAIFKPPPLSSVTLDPIGRA
jgi:hypothetical protein